MDRQLDATAPEGQVAQANREQLSRAGVFTVNLIGGPGCGKTSLVQATLQRLVLKRRVGVLTAERYSNVDADRLAPLGDQVLRVDPGGEVALTARQVRPALARLNLPVLDLLLIENVSSLIGPSGVDLGEDVKVAMFSVAAGPDKPAKHPDVVKCAPLVVLNKTDLLKVAPFDTDLFSSTVRRLNPTAEVLEMSAFDGDGIDAWVEWLLRGSPRPKGS
jgi:hydrogenase nickel incorporation protein HypB